MSTPHVNPLEVSGPPDPWRAALVTHLPVVRATVSAVNRRYGQAGEDERELFSDVCLHLMQDDHAVLRRFRGQSSLRTYLHIVARRVLLDRRVRAWGKWRPTARAQALGPVAQRLECLVVRDHFSAEEAIGVLVHAPGALLDYHEAARLYAVLGPRPRARQVSLDEVAEQLCVAPDQAGPSRPELRRQAVRLARALRRALDTLEPSDRRLLCLRYCEGRSVADIARLTGGSQKGLYRRFDRALKRLRRALEHAGIGPDEVRSVMGHEPVDLGDVLAQADPAA